MFPLFKGKKLVSQHHLKKKRGKGHKILLVFKHLNSIKVGKELELVKKDMDGMMT